MDLEMLRECMKSLLKESRYRHSLGVEEVSYDLALIYGYDTEVASIAGILHDCARYLSNKELLKECIKNNLPVTEIEEKNLLLLHAKVGALYAKEKYGIENEDILNAINYHTTGRPAMSLLEKIIYTADCIEPYRKPIPDIDKARKAAYKNLDLAVVMILRNTLEYLTEKGAVIDTLTIETYEYYKKITQTE